MPDPRDITQVREAADRVAAALNLGYVTAQPTPVGYDGYGAPIYTHQVAQPNTAPIEDDAPGIRRGGD